MPEPAGFDDRNAKMQKHLDLDIREMISALTNRLASLQHVQKTTDHDQEDLEEEDDHGVSIITLAGNNVGATMRGEIDEKNNATTDPTQSVPILGEHEALSTYVNSNFQAINNSIMMGGSYTTNDPGVHMDISEYLENKTSASSHTMPDSIHGKKGKKKHKEISKSDQQTDPNSE